jgi:hypothetical protein
MIYNEAKLSFNAADPSVYIMNNHSYTILAIRVSCEKGGGFIAHLPVFCYILNN